MAKVTVSIPDQLLERLDAFCERTFQNRSSFVCQSVLQFMNQSESLVAMVSLSSSLKKIAETGTVDAATMKDLEDIRRIAEVIQDMTPGM